MKKKVLIVLVSIILVDLLSASYYDLHYDEAYYWVWSQNLALSYFDHPPMVAYLLKLATIFSNKIFFIRLPAIFAFVVTVSVIYQLAKLMFQQKVADIALILALSCPIIEASSLLITPDAPLLMFWSLALYFFYRAIFLEQKLSYYWGGVFAGCALLSKYIAVLLFPALILFVFSCKKYRPLLKQKEPYLAAVLALVLFTPVIIWNYQHNFVSFLFQLHHGGVFRNQGDFNILTSLANVCAYFGSQILVAGLFISTTLIYYCYCKRSELVANAKLLFLFYLFIVPVIFFAILSVFKQQEANWPEVSYVAAVILLAYYLERWQIKWVCRISIILMLIVLFIVKLLIPLAANLVPIKWRNNQQNTPLALFFAEKKLFSQAKDYLSANNYASTKCNYYSASYKQNKTKHSAFLDLAAGSNKFGIIPTITIIGCDYANASNAWYYLNLASVYVMPDFPFANAYRYFKAKAAIMPINNGIMFCDDHDMEKLMKHDFKQVQLLKDLVVRNVFSNKHLYIYKVSN